MRSTPNKYPLGNAAGTSRRYFENDTVFSDREGMAGLLVSAYHVSAERSAESARRAIVNGDAASLAAARWDEAVTQTLERVLSLLPSDESGHVRLGSDSLELPERPGSNAE